MAITIRPRSEDDLPDLAKVLVRVHSKDGYPVEGVADPIGWLRHNHELQSWAAIEDDLPVGQVTLTRAQPEDDAARAWQKRTNGDITRLAIPARLFVDPKSRGTGAGQLLMEAVISFAREREFAIAFDVMLKDRAAIRLYKRLGAIHIADIAHSYGNGLSEPAAVYVVPTA